MTDTPDTDNVIPPNELERRRRVMQLTDDMADFIKDIYDRALELSELGVPVGDWMDHIAHTHAPPAVQALVAKYGSLVGPFLDGMISARRAGAKTPTEGVVGAMADLLGRGLRPSGMPPRDEDVMRPYTNEDISAEISYSMSGLRMKRVITRLFADAPKMTDASGKPDDTQAPALMCHVMLAAGGALQGTLSVTPEGTLRLAMPNTLNGKPVIVEHFFDYEQVADIAVFREVNASMGPRIITS